MERISCDKINVFHIKRNTVIYELHNILQDEVQTRIIQLDVNINTSIKNSALIMEIW